MGVRFGAFASAFLVCGSIQPCFAGEVVMEVLPWPPAKSCAACVTLQFGVLEMQLPVAQVGKIFVSGTAPFAVHLLPLDQDARRGALFMSTTRVEHIAQYGALGLAGTDLMTAQAFFDMLGHPVPVGEPAWQVRRLEHIAGAERYIKVSKGAVHAYWIRSASENSQYVHFAVDGSDVIYSLVGTITPQLYDAVLANLRVRPEP